MNDALHKDRVLVVDDQPMNVKLLATHLTAAGYEVLTAYNGEEALTIAVQSLPDIILLDIMMPGIDGYEVTARLRGNPDTRNISIVLVTALDGLDDKVRGLDCGADDFLAKPVNYVELLARVRSLVKLKKLQVVSTNKGNRPYSDVENLAEDPERTHLVMIVEDDKKMAEYYRVVLKSAGYEAVIAYDGKESDDILAQTMPDLILLDMMLPDISGIELLRKWRTGQVLRNIPIIILSAVSSLDIKVKGIETGADDYLVKPVNSIELLARIRSNLNKYDLQRKISARADRFFIQSVTDSLTGLYNRKYIQTVFDREIAYFQRYGLPFSLLMIDIDRFKSINDTFGHPAGDSVLKELALILREYTRASDLAARYGGEEFAVILHSKDIQSAILAAENLRQSVERHRFPCVNGQQITVSIGVSESRAGDDEQSIIKRADEALYRAKEDGRNRVAGS